MLDHIQSGQEHNAALQAGITQAAKPNYLGDIQVVEYLLREFARTAINRRNPPEDPKPNNEKDKQDCLKLADILLGQNPLYTPMPSWNKPGQIDEWIAQELNVKNETPQEVVACAFAEFLADIYALYNLACQPNTKDEQWTPQIDLIVGKYRNLLLGVKRPTVTKAEILARQEDCEDD
jgi:hypothetical protein